MLLSLEGWAKYACNFEAQDNKGKMSHASGFTPSNNPIPRPGCRESDQRKMAEQSFLRAMKALWDGGLAGMDLGAKGEKPSEKSWLDVVRMLLQEESVLWRTAADKPS